MTQPLALPFNSATPSGYPSNQTHGGGRGKGAMASGYGPYAVRTGANGPAAGASPASASRMLSGAMGGPTGSRTASQGRADGSHRAAGGGGRGRGSSVQMGSGNSAVRAPSGSLGASMRNNAAALTASTRGAPGGTAHTRGTNQPIHRGALQQPQQMHPPQATVPSSQTVGGLSDHRTAQRGLPAAAAVAANAAAVAAATAGGRSRGPRQLSPAGATGTTAARGAPSTTPNTPDIRVARTPLASAHRPLLQVSQQRPARSLGAGSRLHTSSAGDRLVGGGTGGGSRASPGSPLVAGRTPKAADANSGRARHAAQASAAPASGNTQLAEQQRYQAANCQPSRPAAQEDRAGSVIEDGNVMIGNAASEHNLVGLEQQKRENVLARFFRDLQQDRAAADAILQPRMDVALYWEKRRMQNSLRRVLESLQEWFGLEGDHQSGDLGSVFDNLAQSVGIEASPAASFDESRFHCALEHLSLWPPELSSNDRSEVFSTLLVPTCSAASAAIGAPLRTNLMRRGFCEGFSLVPFNLPDFPVPSHLLAPGLGGLCSSYTSEQTLTCAQAVATIFCMEKTGIDRIKDFFASGLISLEEIQTALPRLMPHALVEEAVVRIIRLGGPLLSAKEWADLVTSVRTPEACGATESAFMSGQQKELCAATAQQEQLSLQESSPDRQQQTAMPSRQQILESVVSLASPMPQRRELDRWLEPKADSEAQGQSARFGGRFEPATEPLPSRELRSEEPVKFHFGSFPEPKPAPAAAQPAAPVPMRVVDWSTVGAKSAGGATSSHQADEGAGARHSWGTSALKQGLAAAAAGVNKTNGLQDEEVNHGGPDPVAWIGLDLHNECGGPYLAHAFVRCCQLYDKRRWKENQAQR
eukprot:gnl/TRDRNA2_/TRDRNA2_40215_c0_seq1.p1 gnl/TRDRNA2_/TRDRNA2_40215_c0~~gnl/TRDRNA2_/TRDRNA2_40215_c0_seq1.p1  ORF type:complete len:870 (-),score=152.57 gnl/TRDRNA2_/TRDRNA2_40215_c0_seq1:57-2666(-)